jgi:PAS domain S-box-containing protein
MRQSATSAAEDSFEEAGDEPTGFSTVSKERRRTPRPGTMIGYLGQLTANTLLQRLATPMLAVCHDGIILYANPACEAMLGYGDNALAGQPLNRFLDVDSGIGPPACVQALRESAGSVTAWRHAELGTVHAVVSPSMLIRSDDPLLLVCLIDVSEWLWTFGPGSTPPRLQQSPPGSTADDAT